MYEKVRVVRADRWRSYVLLKVEWEGGGPKPGQFFMVRLSHFHIPRPFSVFDFQEGLLHFLILKKGKITGLLHALEPGDTLYLLGPLGNSFPLEEDPVLVAGGVGISPLHFYKRLYGGTLLWGVKSFLEAPPWIKADRIASEDGSLGVKGTVLQLLEGDERLIYACGPRAMLSALKDRVKKARILVSMEEVMGCGLGLCYGCSIKTKEGFKRICREGPIFNLEELECLR